MNSGSKTLAGLCHFLQIIAGFIPAIIFFFAKGDDEFVKEHAKEVLNFQITITIAYAISFVLSFVLIGLLLLPLISIFTLVFSILGGMKAMNGEIYRYPATFRFIP